MSTETWSTKADSHIMEYNMLWTAHDMNSYICIQSLFTKMVDY